jgi:hypothetical protein
MHGTDKQISWAINIVDNALNNQFNGLLRVKAEMVAYLNKKAAEN